MITREDAIKALEVVIYSGILDEKVEDDLKEIASCIEAEEYGRHIWGAESDYIDSKYRFSPSPFERGEESDTERHKEDAEKD